MALRNSQMARRSGWALGFAIAAFLLQTPLARAAGKTVLVYTRNYTPDGKGYVHDNIQTSVDTIKKMGAENGFAVEVSDDAKIFTDASLKRFNAIIFSNSNNEAFENDAQRDAFQRY